MKIQKIQLSELKPLEKNVRKHNDIQIKELMRSVSQFGQTRAIVVDEENNILIGNGLHAAMVKAGMEEAFIYRKKGLSEIEKKKLILADNKTFSLGVDDYANIEFYLEEITASGDFDIAGFDDDSLRALMRDAEDVLQDVQSYGILDKAEIETKQQAAAKIDQKMQTHAQASTDPVPGVLEDGGGAEYPEEEETQMSPVSKAVRTIICPGCGEVITID